MKNIKLFMCLLCIAFTFRAQAQTDATKNPQDTVMIQLQGANQVFITGKSLQELMEYQRADTLKALFFADLRNSLAGQELAETPKRIHYFVNQQGKRRLKAEINEDAATKFDLAYEKYRMKLDLPALHYTVYDLPKNVSIHFFLEDTLAFNLATNTPLSSGLQLMQNDRKKLGGLSVYRLRYTGFGYESQKRIKQFSLQLTTFAYAGATLLGNQLSPVISSDMYFSFPASNRFRIGFSYSGFVLTDFADGQFKHINPGTFWQGILQFNFDHDKEQWMGVSVGQISNKDANGLPKNVLKTGLITHHNRNSFAFDVIYLDNDHLFRTEQKRNLLMLTYRRSFF